MDFPANSSHSVMQAPEETRSNPDGTPKTALFVIGQFPPPVQGAAVITEKLFNFAVANKIAASSISISPGNSAGWRHHLIRLSRTIRGFVQLISVGHRIVIMSVDGGLGILYNLMLALAMRARQHKILLYHHSASYVFSDSVLLGCLIALAGPDSLHIMCSERMAALFSRRYGERCRIIAVGNTAWMDSPKSYPRPYRRKIRIGHLSGLTTDKGLDRAIDTLRELHRQRVEAELILAGAPMNDLANEIIAGAQAEFADAFQYLGVLSGGTKDEYYANLDYFLFPSLYRHETQSLVVPEALAAGVPVIAHDHHFVGELVGEKGGLLIPSGENFAMCAASWIVSGDLEKRRGAARLQFDALQLRALRQKTHLLNLMVGTTE
jgi:glycosyltransferase involved in cell wall biosynthesis